MTHKKNAFQSAVQKIKKAGYMILFGYDEDKPSGPLEFPETLIDTKRKEFLAKKDSPEVVAALNQSGIASLIKRIEKHGRFENVFVNDCVVDDMVIRLDGWVCSYSSRKKLYRISKDLLIYVRYAIEQRRKQLLGLEKAQLKQRQDR